MNASHASRSSNSSDHNLTAGDLPKVLIVDDEAGLRGQLAFRFRMEGFKVLEARGGHEARLLVGTDKPHVVITDIRMADGSGKEFIEWAVGAFPNGDAPIILCMTGYSDLSAEAAYGKRVSGFFNKPFDLDELVAATRHFVADYLDKKHLRDLAKVNESERKIMGQSAAVFAHEIMNPLTMIQFSLESLQKLEKAEGGSLKQPEVKQKIDRAMSSAQFLARNVQGIRLLYKAPLREEEKTPVDLESTINRSLELVQAPDHAKSTLDVSIFIHPRCREIRTSAEAMEIILCNLLRNGLHATTSAKDARPLQVRVGPVAGTKPAIAISVSNYGSGINDDVAAYIFDMGFSTKGAFGMGIGLAVSAQLARRLGGSLRLQNPGTRAGDPTEFVLEIPS